MKEPIIIKIDCCESRGLAYEQWYIETAFDRLTLLDAEIRGLAEYLGSGSVRFVGEKACWSEFWRINNPDLSIIREVRSKKGYVMSTEELQVSDLGVSPEVALRRLSFRG